MDVIHDRVAGLDVHKDSVVACVRTMSGTKATRECRTYATTTDGLLALLEWLSFEPVQRGRDGGDRRLLDAGVEDIERWRVRACARQRERTSRRSPAARRT